MSEIRFDGQVAIVTGAGHGLGRAYAAALGARGAAVVCNDIAAGDAEAVAAEIVDRGGRAIPQTSSVATPVGGAAIVQAAVDTFGSVEVVVNNAGQLRNAAFEEMTVDEFQDVLQTHLAGAFHVTQLAYRHMKAAGYGRIVFTSSSAGMFGSPWQANYGAAKAGLIGLCNVVALEGARHGIAANAVMPMALTGMNRGGPPPYAPDDLEATINALKPLARYMTVDNVAPLVVYLASRECDFTHRIFSVGAGRVAEVFVAVTEGWFAPALECVSPEQVAEHLEAACNRSAYAVPQSIIDESHFIVAHLPTVERRSQPTEET